MDEKQCRVRGCANRLYHWHYCLKHWRMTRDGVWPELEDDAED